MSWNTPPDYVEVIGIYSAIDADDGLYSDEFTGTDVGGNSFSLDFGGATIVYIQALIAFSDPGGSENAQESDWVDLYP